MKLVKEFYDFMFEREMIRLRRLHGLPREQWTSDKIFKEYSFTNVKRHHDRTTTLLKLEMYDQNAEAENRTKLLNAALYRYFGTIDAARVLGWTETWDAESRERVMAHGAMDRLKYTPAYIVPAAGRSDPKYVVVCDIIDAIWACAPIVVQQTKWEDAIDAMRECYGVGSFMAKEVYLDYLLATGFVPEDWQTWTPTGPGGKRGASCIAHGDAYKISEREALDVIRQVYARADEFWPKQMYVQNEQMTRVTAVDPVKLDLTDIQFQCCEFDKYQRVVRGDGKPKRRFWPTVDGVTKADTVH